MSFLVSSDKRKIGKTTETRIYVRKPNNKAIESEEVRGIYNEIMEKIERESPDAKLLIRGDNNLNQHWTLKGFLQEDLNFEDYEEYFVNKVSDPTKFDKFTQLAFIVHV